MLKRAMRGMHGAGRAVRIVDIAAGVGRYVIETMREMPEVGATAVLRDNVEGNVAAARELAAKLGVEGVTVVRGDAFDRAGLAGLTPPPTIAIVSGLYELFPENAGVRESLRGLGEAVEEGGFLIYTCQPWHPQMEFIGRVLRNREGKPWVMRRRMQAEMDCLVREAGFEKVDMEIDPWGIFTVSMARRVKR